jgi:aspartyl protease family protein
MHNREDPMRPTRYAIKLASIWLGVTALAFAGIKYWESRQEASMTKAHGVAFEIRRAPDGHYHWSGHLNGEAVEFLIDTGASSTALPAALATRLGLPVVGSVRSLTASGEVQSPVVVADLVLVGGFDFPQLPIVVPAGLFEQPLLGMDVLGRLAWRQADGILRIERR